MENASNPAAFGEPSDKYNVLLIDDDDGIRESLREILEMQGSYEVTCAADGAAGMKMLRERDRPSLIVLDLMMPVMDGWQVLEALSAHETLSSIPVLVTSAVRSRPTSAELRGARFMAKPFDYDELLEAVAGMCAARPAACLDARGNSR